jgi:hypothetical protein
MPNEHTTATPDPEDAPQSPAATPPAVDAPQPDVKPEDQGDPLLDIIRQDLGLATAKPEDKPVPAAPAPDTKPATTPPRDEPVKVTKRRPIEEVVEKSIEKALSKSPTPLQPQPTPKDPPKSEVKPEEESTEGWLPEEVEELRLAESAEKHIGDKYKGMPAQIRKFKSKVQEYISKGSKENPDRTFDENDPEFMEFVEAEKPKWQGNDRRAVERKMLVEEAVTEAEKRTGGKFEAQRKEIEEMRTRPKIEQAVTQFRGSVSKTMEQEEAGAEEFVEIAKRVHEIGPEAAIKEMPLTATILVQCEASAAEQAQEFLNLSSGLTEFDPKNDKHLWLGQFIKQQGEAFAAQGGEHRMRTDPTTGQQQEFIPRAKWTELSRSNPQELSKYWTFSDQDVLTILGLAARQYAKTKVMETTGMLKAEGYVRQPRAKAAAQANPQTAAPRKVGAASPAVTPSISPGAASAGSVGSAGGLEGWALEALGIPTKT